jgi:hypothetical protein
MTANSKSEERDFVYVGEDDTIFVPPVSGCPIAIPNEEDGKTLRRYWTRRIDGSDPRVRRAPRTLVAPANDKRPRFCTTWVSPRLGPYPGYRVFPEMRACL